MKTDVQQTSIDAYHNLKHQHRQLDRVYNAIEEHGPICIADLALIVGLCISTTSARINALRKMGWLKFAGRKPSRSTKVTANHWTVKGVRHEEPKETITNTGGIRDRVQRDGSVIRRIWPKTCAQTRPGTPDESNSVLPLFQMLR